MNQKQTILEFRNKKIEGKIIDLIPLQNKDLSKVVEIRNQPKSMYFFNQGSELTIEMQEEWFEKYLLRDDDIYWGIFTKNGMLIGTQRIYDITEMQCEQGSTVLDEKESMGAPYAAEAILLSLRFAFDVLGVKIVINDNRFDNKNMNSISKKVGFKFKMEKEIRGVKYLYHELAKEDFDDKRLEAVIDNWVNR